MCTKEQEDNRGRKTWDLREDHEVGVRGFSTCDERLLSTCFEALLEDSIDNAQPIIAIVMDGHRGQIQNELENGGDRLRDGKMKGSLFPRFRILLFPPRRVCITSRQLIHPLLATFGQEVSTTLRMMFGSFGGECGVAL